MTCKEKKINKPKEKQSIKKKDMEEDINTKNIINRNNNRSD